MIKEKLLIVGSGGFGRVVSEHALKEYECSFVDDGYEVGTEICGVKVVGHIADLNALFAEYKLLIVAIGSNSFRERIYREMEIIGFQFPNIVSENVYISPFAMVGQGCIFLNNVCVQNGSTIGNGVILNPGVEIHHGAKVEDYALIYTNSVIRTYATVGKRAKIGSNVTIANGVEIETGAVVDDGATLSLEGAK